MVPEVVGMFQKEVAQRIAEKPGTKTYGIISVLLQAFYEMDAIEPMFSLMDSFRTYLNRHKEIPQNRRRNYTNLIRFLKKLTNTLTGDQKGIEKLKVELNNMEGIAASKNWLNDKIAELE